MLFSELSPHEKMIITVNDLKRKKEKQKNGEREANYHLADTFARIDRRLASERKKRNYRW